MKRTKKNNYVYNNELLKKQSSRFKNDLDLVHLKTYAEELDDYALKNSNIRRSVDKIKGNSIQEMIYTNFNVPDKWKAKVNYHDFFFDLISRKKPLIEYLLKDELIKIDKVTGSATTGGKTQILRVKKFKSKANTNDLESEMTTSPLSLRKAKSFISVTTNYNSPQSIVKRTSISKLSSINKSSQLTLNKANSFKFDLLNETSKLPPIRKHFKSKNTLEVLNKESFDRKCCKFKGNAEIKEKEMRDLIYLISDSKSYGPYSSLCSKCNYKNVSFYNSIDKETGLKILNYFKEKL